MSSVDTRGLAPVEIASHVLFGQATRERLPEPTRPFEALQEIVREALEAPPCFVTFSGGRDSSAILGLAALVAERHGLPAPIAVTAEFPDAAASDEREWQELVLRTVKVGDWIRRAYGDELDLVGPVAAASLRRDGLSYPFNLHLLEPLIAEAGGGTLITGVGGDQFLDAAGDVRDVLARRVRPTLREAAHTGIALSPRAVRRRFVRDAVARPYPWLSADGRSALDRALLARELDIPLRWNRDLHHRWRSRAIQVNLAGLGEIARRHEVSIVHPLSDARFVASLADDGGAFGFRTRTEIMERLFAGVMPDELNRRQTKAWFEEVIWTRHSKAFVERLDEDRLSGALRRLGVEGLVDPSALLATWREPMPHANSFLLLQGCWLALEGGNGRPEGRPVSGAT